ncbi:MAG: SusC/RagA family TonB-linked outer membrane protein, partial [Cyclobacteriaceae bacterium]
MKIIIPHLTMVGKFYLYGLVVQICFLNLLSAAPSNGQNNMDLQKVYLDLNLNQYPLVSTFDEIEKRTDFNFFYDEILNDHPHLVNLHVTHRNLEEVLLELAASHQLSFKQVGEKISVKWNKNKNARKVLVVEISISGKVTDESGVPIPGATVSVAGTSIGTVTDQDGNYVLEVPEGGTIFFSFIGFKSQNILVQNQQTIDVTLSEDVGSLDEVVVVGYGTQKKENLTGAVDVISNEQIQNRQSPTVSQLLQGQSPGISFSVGNNGFQPGAEMGINIRGIGSLNGGSPFVLIDGIPGEMDRLNPDDIESISVLKDAAASAVYGARAPYGVILITTKSGQNNEKISATYSGSLSVATPQRLPSMVDSYTHALAINEAGVAGNGGRTYTNQVVDRIIAYQDGDIDYLRQFTVPDATHFETVPLSNGFWGQMQQGHANYDWFDEYYGSALNQKHNLSLQGGSQSTSFYFSAGYFGQEGVLNYGTDNFERLNIMAKVKTQIADWWSFTYQPRFMKSTRIMPNPQNGGNYGIIFHQIARTMPMQAKFDGFGNFTLHSKIPWTQDAGINRMETTENWHNFSTVITPLKNWDINADFAYRTTDYFQSDQALTIYEYRVDQSTVPNGNTVPSSIQQYHHSNNYWNSNIFSSYAFTLGDKHNFNWLAGMQLERNNIRQLRVIK